MLWLSEQFNYYRIKILNQIYGHIKVSIYIYAHLKHLFKKSTENNFALKVLTVLLSPMVFLILWTLKLSRALIKLWIVFKEGDDFMEMMDGTETLFLLLGKPKMRAVITTLMYVEYDGDGDEFSARCQKEFTAIFSLERFQKLRCEVVLAHGYYYYRHAHWPMREHFKDIIIANNNNNKMADISTEQLRVAISDIANAPMPLDDVGLWEVRIGKQKLDCGGKPVYPVVFRFHHVFGDAVTLFNMFSAEFQNGFSLSSVKVAGQRSEEALRSLDATHTQKPFITMSGVIDPPDSNVLCQANGRKHVVWHTEERPEVLDTMKDIKSKLNNVTVVDIILTCFLESLDQHLRHTANYPSSICTVVPMLPPNIKLNEYGTVSSYQCNNKISLGFLKLPLKLNEGGADSHKRNMLKRIDLIKHEYDVFKNKSLDFMCNRWQAKVLLTLLPRPLSKWLIEKYSVSILVSNIPGCNTLKCFGGLKVKEFIVIDPNTNNSGVTFMITSYEKRLSFAFTIDSETIPHADDVKALLASFLHNLQMLKQFANE